MLRTLRDSRVTLWLRHGSWDTQLPPPPYFEILICDTKAIKGVLWGQGQGTKEVSVSVSTLNRFCCPCCRGRLDCQALRDMMGKR